MRELDLNSDLGEGFGVWRLGDDDALLDVVTSANVACGFHAGDPATMRAVCAAAARRGVAIGAQVSYRDLAGFGRRFIDVDPAVAGRRDPLPARRAVRVRQGGGRRRRVRQAARGALQRRGAPRGAGPCRGRRRAAFGALPVLGLPGSRLLAAAARRACPSSTRRSPTAATPAEGTLVPRARAGRPADRHGRRRRAGRRGWRPTGRDWSPSTALCLRIRRPVAVPARGHPRRGRATPAPSATRWTSAGVRWFGSALTGGRCRVRDGLAE